VAEDEFIWQAAGRAGIDLPSRCRIGWCLTCAARLLEPGEVDQSAARRYFAADRAAGYILPCTARPRSDLVIATHQAAAMRRHREALGLPATLE
jgi:ferredoxin